MTSDNEKRDRALAHYVRSFGETRGIPMYETFCKKVGLDPYPPQPNPDPEIPKPKKVAPPVPEPPKKKGGERSGRG